MKIEIEITGRLEQVLKEDIASGVLQVNPQLETKEEAIGALMLELLKTYVRQNMVL